MNPFEYRAPREISEVTTILSDNPHARIVSGNTDLINEIKEGIVRPTVMVSLSKIRELSHITWSHDALVIGSMVTLKDLVSNEEINSKYSAISQAANSVATPQIRNLGTLGGNLCQRPRCWYYRSARFDCLKKGGDVCFAVDGLSKYHAIYGDTNCHIVHPSDLATVLTSLNASIDIQGPGESRNVPISRFFTGPEVNIQSENCLGPEEFITSIRIPREYICYTSIFVKAKERSALDFALVSAAVAIKKERNFISDALITLGGVAPVPWKLPYLERDLIGSDIDVTSCDLMVRTSLSDATPMKHNHYKVPLAQAYLKRALHDVLMRLSLSHGSGCKL
jgi:xanthine dehydrogenase YagS FAD-binding subunit